MTTACTNHFEASRTTFTVSKLKRVAYRDSESDEGRETRAAEMAAQRASDHGLRRQLMTRADFRGQIGHPPNPFELLGKKVSKQQRRRERECFVHPHAEEPVVVLFYIAGRSEYGAPLRKLGRLRGAAERSREARPWSDRTGPIERRQRRSTAWESGIGLGRTCDDQCRTGSDGVRRDAAVQVDAAWRKTSRRHTSQRVRRR